MVLDYSKLPRVDHVLDAEPLRSLPWDRNLKKRAVLQSLQHLREQIRKSGEEPPASGSEIDCSVSTVAETCHNLLQKWTKPHPHRVINATGVLLHTNLGRAPLASSAIEAMVEAAGTCNLEIDLGSGSRGNRLANIKPLLAQMLDAEDVHIANNGAAALLLACTALGQGKNSEQRKSGIVLSRGQMVEIGDGFRVATMAGAGGTPLFEVGSTNRTHLRDYEAALRGDLPAMNGQGAAVILWAHLSNFEQQGFVKEVELEQLAHLAKQYDVPLIADIGSGSLGKEVSSREPTVMEYVRQGADVVTCSGDKLFCGPQAGIMAGRKELIERCRRHPMARALRPDKICIAALHATLREHARQEFPQLPLHQMIRTSQEELRERAMRITQALGWSESLIGTGRATVGGGSLPGDMINSILVTVPTTRPSRVAARLRSLPLPVVGRIHEDRLVMDIRSVQARDDVDLIESLREIADLCDLNVG